MSRLPKIPMSPREVPQQRISEVVSMPPRPVLFDFKVGYGDFPPDVVPKQGVPRSPELLAQVEWAETPTNYGINAFYLQARKKYWVLWLRTFDDNSYPWQWNWQAIGYCNRPNVDRGVAAKHLLLEYWKFKGSPDENPVDDEPLDWINEEGLLSIADVRAIVRELYWQVSHNDMEKQQEEQILAKLSPGLRETVEDVRKHFPDMPLEKLIQEIENAGG